MIILATVADKVANTQGMKILEGSVLFAATR